MRTLFRRCLAALAVAACLTEAGACMRFTPFQVDLDDDQIDETSKNLRRLAAVPSTPGETITFGLMSDTHDGYATASDIFAQLDLNPDVRFVVHAGDFTDFGSQQEFVWFHDRFVGRRAPCFVAAGNHDGLANGKELYGQMFGPTNFSFRHASVKVVVFNTNTIEYGVAQPDLDWLEREVNDRAEGEGVVVVTHHPPDSRPHFTEEAEARYRQIQRDANVLANLHGHIHQDYLLMKDGPTHYLRVKAALDGAYALITTNGKSLSWAKCASAVGCEPPEVLVP